MKTISTPTKTRDMHETLRQIPYNLFAIGVGSESRRDHNAFVASWAMQCSFEPPLIAVAVRKDAISLQLVKEEEAFSLNLLSKKQANLAKRLVKPNHRVGDKLGQISHFGEETDTPILRDAIAYLECRVVNLVDAGDHCLAIGEVVNAHQASNERPLACSDVGWTYGG